MFDKKDTTFFSVEFFKIYFFIKTLDPDPNPDPNSLKMLDPNPLHCLPQFLLATMLPPVERVSAPSTTPSLNTTALIVVPVFVTYRIEHP
jgi:hypothetical protein